MKKKMPDVSQKGIMKKKILLKETKKSLIKKTNQSIKEIVPWVGLFALFTIVVGTPIAGIGWISENISLWFLLLIIPYGYLCILFGTWVTRLKMLG